MTRASKYYDVYTVSNQKSANRPVALGVVMYPLGYGEDQYEVSADVLGPAHDVPGFSEYKWFAVGDEPGTAEKGDHTVGLAVFCVQSLEDGEFPKKGNFREHIFGTGEPRYELSERQLRHVRAAVEESMREELGLDREDLIAANERVVTQLRKGN